MKALRECLEKHGVTLPQRTPGARSGGPGGFLGAGPHVPKGMSRAQYEAAIKKCGGRAFGGSGFHGGRLRNNPAAKQALVKFAQCMRSNGVNVPEPNTSGSGPVFNTKGMDTASPKFKAAEAKCSSNLRGALGVRPEGPPGTGTSGTGSASAG